MERRVAKKIESYQVDFKNQIKIWLEKEGGSIKSGTEDKTSELKSIKRRIKKGLGR